MAIATLTDDAFFPATLVCLHSFLETNPWFDGDLAVVHTGLAPRWQDLLTHTFPRVRLERVSPDLEALVDRYLARRPDLAALRTRFFCLDVFRLRGYDRVLFCDADVLFRKDVGEIFDSRAPLLASGECLHYAGLGRDAETLQARQLDGSPGVLRNTFNTGILSLGGDLLTDSEYGHLLQWLDSTRALGGSVRMSFQAVANQHFAGRQQLISARFNYLLRCHRSIDTVEGITLSDAHVLHFAGPCKPWRSSDVLTAGIADPLVLRAAQLWQDALVRAAGAAHLRLHGSVNK